MPSSKQRNIKVKKISRKLDLIEFEALTELLFVALKENNRACARVLGISPSVWKRWTQTPPRWIWWNYVLRHVIKQVVSSMEGRRGLTYKHKRLIITKLSAIPHNEDFIEDIEDMSYTRSAAASHLQRLLIKGGRWKDEIFTTAKMGGFSRTSLELAARQLEIVKTQEGYGSDKRSYWRLPNEDDD